jgi:general secretion pathway protein D
MVFLRPIIVRDESTSAAIAAERYEYMRTQMVDARAPDTLIFRDLGMTSLPASNDPRLQPAPAAAAPPAASPPAPTAPPSPAVTAPPAVAPPPSTVQLLQVTAMPDLASGSRIQQDLRNAGFDAYVEPVRTSTGEIYRVRVAVDTTRRSVADATTELRKLGYQPFPIQR